MTRRGGQEVKEMIAILKGPQFIRTNDQTECRTLDSRSPIAHALAGLPGFEITIDLSKKTKLEDGSVVIGNVGAPIAFDGEAIVNLFTAPAATEGDGEHD